jgi:hypothetical protein
MNNTLKQVLALATITGSVFLFVKSGKDLISVKNFKDAIVPAVGILVSAAAFNYSIQSPTVVTQKAPIA